MIMRIHFTCIQGSATGRMFSLNKAIQIMGRGEVDLSIDDPSLSDRHMKVEVDGKTVTVTNLGSKTGVRLNGRPIGSAQVANFDKLQVGDLVFHVEIPDESHYGANPSANAPPSSFESESIQSTCRLSVEKLKIDPLMMEDKEFCLEIYDHGGNRWTHRIDKMITLIGSGNVDVVLDDITVSRKHCELEVLDQKYIKVRDLGSTNATLKNGEPIREDRVSGGDVLKLGRSRLKVILRPLRIPNDEK